MAKKKLKNVHVVSYTDENGELFYEGYISQYTAKNRQYFFMEKDNAEFQRLVTVPIMDAGEGVLNA